MRLYHCPHKLTLTDGLIRAWVYGHLEVFCFVLCVSRGCQRLVAGFRSLGLRLRGAFFRTAGQ